MQAIKQDVKQFFIPELNLAQSVWPEADLFAADHSLSSPAAQLATNSCH